MPTLSKPWTERAKQKLQASHALRYLVGVIDGAEQADPQRLRAAMWAIDKLVPTLKATELSGEVSVTEFRLKAGL